MALLNITPTQIIDTPTIDPSIGGWDALVNNDLAQQRGVLRWGLIARQVEWDPDGFDIFYTVPAGWTAWMTHLMVTRLGVAATGREYDVEVQSPSGGGGTVWHSGIITTNLTSDAAPLLVTPYNAANPWALTTTPAAIAVTDGDVAEPYCRVDRTNGGSVDLDWWAFGLLFPNT